MALKDKIKALADTIREKSGVSGELGWDEMKEAVDSITVGSGGDGGLDTSSTNPATATDIANGKEAFVNGSKVTGNVQVTNEKSSVLFTATSVENAEQSDGSNMLVCTYKVSENNRLFRPNSYIKLRSTYDKFGTATENDVVKGTTFTSIDGFNVIGKHVCSGGGISLPSGITAMTTGEFIPEKDISTSATIEHNLGVTPTFFYITTAGNFNPGANIAYQYGQFIACTLLQNNTIVGNRTVLYANTSGVINATNLKIASLEGTETSIQLVAATNYKLKNGVTYKWVAVALDGMN